jgi:hypothetical protein
MFFNKMVALPTLLPSNHLGHYFFDEHHSWSELMIPFGIGDNYYIHHPIYAISLKNLDQVVNSMDGMTIV